MFNTYFKFSQNVHPKQLNKIAKYTTIQFLKFYLFTLLILSIRGLCFLFEEALVVIPTRKEKEVSGEK